MQTTYRVQVRVTKLVNVEVEANGEDEAMEKAAKGALLGDGFGNGYNHEASSVKVLFIAKEGHPAMPVPTEWQIYSSMAGADKVNAAITQKVTKVAEECVKMAKAGRLSKVAVIKLVETHIKPAFKKHRDYGTGDSEPGDQVADFLSRWCSKLDGGVSEDRLADAIDVALYF